ncbi:DUF397 domain-containing protein [Nocardiopsis alba]|uniref:DUF397 domain-containing protein n=1 Tax=Nocardiopsis alba TaxID=53437 RepID=UPI0033B9ADAE
MSEHQRTWHKASYSGNEGACVEVSEGKVTLVRDTQNRELGNLGFGAQEWTALLSSAK